MRPRLFRPGHPAGALVLVAAMASMVCSGDQARDPAQADTLLTGVTEVIPEVATLPGVPGFAVSAVRGTDLVLEHAYGLADVDTGERLTPRSLFYIASTSKSFTATAAAVLQQRGELDFRQTLADALPEVRLQPPLSPASITIRDLLTMSHGIGRGGPVDFRTAYSGEFTNAELVRLLALHPPSAAGRDFEYGNLGYNILGLVLDVRFKDGWKEVLRREVFEPLGMRDTTGRRSTADPRRLAMPHRRTPSGTTRVALKKQDENMHAAGGHFTTVGDLARYLEAHLNAGRLGGRQVLPPEAIAATHRRPSIRTAGWDPCSAPDGASAGTSGRTTASASCSGPAAFPVTRRSLRSCRSGGLAYRCWSTATATRRRTP